MVPKVMNSMERERGHNSSKTAATLTPHLEEFEKDKKVLIWSRVLPPVTHTIQQALHYTSMPGTEVA